MSVNDAGTSATNWKQSFRGTSSLVALRMVKGCSAAAIALAVGMATWDLVGLIDGSSHVVGVATATTDGGTVGTVLASALWLALALALIGGIMLRRRFDSEAVLELQAPIGPVVIWSRKRVLATVALGTALVLAVYHGLLFPGAITWGDWSYYANASAVRAFFPVPALWSFANLGSNNVLGAPLFPIFSAMGALGHLRISYDILERMWFYYPAVALSFVGPLALLRRLRVGWDFATAGGVFYCVNPYSLILISGGQLTVGVGYALCPWVALAAIGLWSHRTFTRAALLGTVIGVQAWYDPRTAGLSIAAGVIIVITAVLVIGIRRAAGQIPWKALAFSGLIFMLLEGAWILPAVFKGHAYLPSGYTTPAALNSLSLMSLADGLAVFHPFWPSMQFIALHSVPPLWFVVPAAVAVALRRAPLSMPVIVGTASYLSFSALVSGANMPFGLVNTWLFTHVPGMELFRDPSPYLGPAALAAVVVACVGLRGAHLPVLNRVDLLSNGDDDASHSSRLRLTTPAPWPLMLPIVSSLALVLLIYSGWPAISGELRHNLSPRSVPTSFGRLNHDISTRSPGAVLWIPAVSRFALNSPLHPNISAYGLQSTLDIGFPATSQPLAWLTNPRLTAEIMAKYNIAEVVVSQEAPQYVNYSLPFKAALSAARSAFASDPLKRVGGFTLYHLADALPAPAVTVPAKDVTVTDASAQTESIDTSAITATRQPGQPPSVFVGFPVVGLSRGNGIPAGGRELAHNNFSKGLFGWQVGNGNNYLHQTLRQAGIRADIYHHGNDSWLHLEASYGAAQISQRLVSCPKSAKLELTATYRTNSIVAPQVLIFGNAQAPSLADAQLPTTDGQWKSVTVPMYPDASLGSAEPSSCELVLALSPVQAGQSNGAEVRQLSLASVPISGMLASEHDLVTKLSSNQPHLNTDATGTTMQLRFGSSSTPQLVILWQKFDPGWVAATGSGDSLAHVMVNDWANGFVLPAQSKPGFYIVRYVPQTTVLDGFVFVIAGVTIVTLLVGVAIWRRRARLFGKSGAGGIHRS
ncbi:MAG TPA: hypothetical protein VND89_08795 [Acidimicrobiales bacterium]|nr:hypothetical protein [Acidimicrobiales bacterium]